jgi:hypothetical protein
MRFEIKLGNFIDKNFAFSPIEERCVNMLHAILPGSLDQKHYYNLYKSLTNGFGILLNSKPGNRFCYQYCISVLTSKKIIVVIQPKGSWLCMVLLFI